uniref:(northern house mosquito) hypothetical protein n=1 Tax=Culex pipiens TaxID=7175 RepID=A0A8D8G6T0_CULPI
MSKWQHDPNGTGLYAVELKAASSARESRAANGTKFADYTGSRAESAAGSASASTPAICWKLPQETVRNRAIICRRRHAAERPKSADLPWTVFFKLLGVQFQRNRRHQPQLVARDRPAAGEPAESQPTARGQHPVVLRPLQDLHPRPDPTPRPAHRATAGRTQEKHPPKVQLASPTGPAIATSPTHPNSPILDALPPTSTPLRIPLPQPANQTAPTSPAPAAAKSGRRPRAATEGRRRCGGSRRTKAPPRAEAKAATTPNASATPAAVNPRRVQLFGGLVLAGVDVLHAGYFASRLPLRPALPVGDLREPEPLPAGAQPRSAVGVLQKSAQHGGRRGRRRCDDATHQQELAALSSRGPI